MKNNKVPTLQFKSEKSEWSWKCLKEISKKITDKNKENQYTETLTNSAELGIINQRDYFDKDISNKKNLNGYYIVKPDDFVYNPRISIFAPVGPIKRNKLGRTGVMSPLYYVFRTQHIDLAYLEAYFSSVKWHLYMKQNGDSGARSDRFSIKDSVFGEMPIPYPSKEIQKKIGSFFKKLDDTISLHQQELEVLKQTRQGFLQKMFPKEGETIPSLRFKGYLDKWTAVKLEEKVNIFNNLRVPVTSSNRVKGKTPYYGANGVQDYVEGHTHNGEFVLIAEDGANDLINYPVQYVTGKVWVNNHAHVVSGKSQKLDTLFLKYRINSMNVSKYLVGGGRSKLNLEALKKLLIIIPSFEEQVKIGEFFRQLDEVIELKEKEIEALKETKKGFLQKMFV